MPLNSTQLVTKYSETLTCCLNNTSNTIDFLFASSSAESVGGTNVCAIRSDLIVSSANVSNGTVVFSPEYNISIKFDSGSKNWKTFDDSRNVLNDIKCIYGVGLNGLYQITQANTNNQCAIIASDRSSDISEWKCAWPAKSQSYNSHAFGLKNDGSLWGWGCFYYHLPSGTNACARYPFQIFANFDLCKLELPCNYNTSTAALKTNGELWTWGCMQSGERGIGTTNNVLGPTRLMAPANTWSWIDVTNASTTMAAIKNDGTLWAWGFNGAGQIGDGTSINRCSPVSAVSPNCNWCRIASVTCTMSAIKTDGTLWTWGCNYAGLLGIGTSGGSRCSPGTTVGLQGDWCYVTGHNMGQVQSFYAIQLDGTLWSWGQNTYGQLGQGFLPASCSSVLSPVTVAGGGTTWCSVHTGQYNTFGIKTDGTLWTWGGNSDFTLGLNCSDSNYSVASPVQITYLAGNWKTASLGKRFSYLFTGREIT